MKLSSTWDVGSYEGNSRENEHRETDRLLYLLSGNVNWAILPASVVFNRAIDHPGVAFPRLLAPGPIAV